MKGKQDKMEVPDPYFYKESLSTFVFLGGAVATVVVVMLNTPHTFFPSVYILSLW